MTWTAEAACVSLCDQGIRVIITALATSKQAVQQLVHSSISSSDCYVRLAAVASYVRC